MSHQLPAYICGEAVNSIKQLEVFNPYSNEQVGSAALIDQEILDDTIEQMLNQPVELTRYQRYEILSKAHQLLNEQCESFAQLICAESGLCMRETRYEVGRACDVLQFAAMESLKDDGQIFSCDISPQGKKRKIFTLREPLRLAAAITPFNHPLNQVVHKLAPAVAAGTPIILKPSDKTPLTAIRFAELLYQAGLPGPMLSVFTGPIDTVVEPLVKDERIELISFTGSVAIGKHIAKIAGYKKQCLELGGNSPLIILEDADLNLAVKLAAEGCFRNSGQRCTAVKRLLVHEAILETFTDRFVNMAETYICGDPSDEKTRVGTVIDENSAKHLERVVQQSERDGAKVIFGGKRQGALLQPTVIANVPRHTEMVVQESFGPLAPIIPIKDIDDAIELSNGTAYGLSTGIVSNHLSHILKAVKHIRTGTVNVNEVPGYRVECSPFGGVKDSGLGIKEGVIEAMKFMSNTKTFSLPW